MFKFKNNKKLVICIIAAVAVVAIAIIIFLIYRGGSKPINDEYFVSDDSKYVLTAEATGSEFTGALKQHDVFFYSGEKITGAKVYYEFADNEAAKAAYEEFRNGLTNGENNDSDLKAEDVRLDNKYIVLDVSDKDGYANMTASEVKRTTEFYNSIDNSSLDPEISSDSDLGTGEEETNEEVDEAVDEEEETLSE